MKKIILSCVALVAAFVCASTISAQGIKVHKTNGAVIDIPAAELSHIEAYDAAATPAFEGTWKMKELVTTAAVMTERNYGMVTFGDAFPAFEASDELTFKDGKIIPNLTSNLKNFFIGEATYEIVNEAYVIRPTATTGEAVTLTELKVKGVNRYFDANSTSEDDEAYIGVRLVEDEDADEPGIYFLEVYLFDYKSTSFAPEWNDFMMYTDTKPQAAYSDMPIYFSMSKKEASVRKKEPVRTYNISNKEGFDDFKLYGYGIAYFYAQWSGPCKLTDKVLNEELAKSNETVAYARIDVDQCKKITDDCEVECVPTILLYHYGEVVERIVGVPTKGKRETIRNFIRDANTLPYSRQLKD